MLPLCFGEATKVCAFLLDADKTYRVTARLGTATSTGDADGGETIATAEVPALSSEQWNDILQGFKGESLQVPGSSALGSKAATPSSSIADSTCSASSSFVGASKEVGLSQATLCR